MDRPGHLHETDEGAVRPAVKDAVVVPCDTDEVLPADVAEGFVAAVKRTAETEIREATGARVPPESIAQLLPGKMLRSRLAARLFAGGGPSLGRPTLERLCAATEMVHTASLLHDDVMDNGLMRRALPTLWTQTSASASILIGDVLLCKAMDLLAATAAGRFTRKFVSKVREVCAAEAEQEIFLRGKPVNRDTCLRLARQKTGPFFAFSGFISGGDDEKLACALEEVGYRIGTAYQVFDDLVDVCGSEDVARKTLGTDVARRKYTLPQDPEGGIGDAMECVAELRDSAVGLLADYPRARRSVETFLQRDLEAVFARNLAHTGVKAGLHP